MIRGHEVSHQVFLIHMKDAGVLGHLLQHPPHVRKVGPVGHLQLLTGSLEVGLEPLLTVVEVSVLILHNAFRDLAGEGIGNRDVDVIGRDGKGFDQNRLNQQAGDQVALG